MVSVKSVEVYLRCIGRGCCCGASIVSFAGIPVPGALSELPGRAQRKTREDAESHHALPLGLANKLGQVRELSAPEK
jgi:hypothetical protein